MRIAAGFVIGLIVGCVIVELKIDLPIYRRATTDKFDAIAKCLSTGP
jgi:hypothetical protein